MCEWACEVVRFVLCVFVVHVVTQDTSTGELVAEHRTKLGSCEVLRQNPYNAVVSLGHSNGVWHATTMAHARTPRLVMQARASCPVCIGLWHRVDVWVCCGWAFQGA